MLTCVLLTAHTTAGHKISPQVCAALDVVKLLHEKLGYQFTCFISTKVPILTQKALQRVQRQQEALAESVANQTTHVPAPGILCMHICMYVCMYVHIHIYIL
jgi:hypothetical protein